MHELSCTIARGWGEITASVWAKRAENTKAILDHQVMKETNIKRRKELRRNPDEEQERTLGRSLSLFDMWDSVGSKARIHHRNYTSYGRERADNFNFSTSLTSKYPVYVLFVQPAYCLELRV